MDLLMNHDWPGNVRELRNALESAVVVGESDTLKPEDINLAQLSPSSVESVSDEDVIRAGMSLEDAEEILVKKTLEANDGNITQSADELGITRKTLRNKKEKYDIE
jgi:DNA-binding NtrC family response regulator